MLLCCFASVILIAGDSIALGQEATKEKSPYAALGAPTKPKVAAHWNRYHDYAESSKLLAELAAAHPEYAKLQSLGKSYGGRGNVGAHRHQLRPGG